MKTRVLAFLLAALFLLFEGVKDARADVTAPAAVTSLSALIGSQDAAVRLSWISPGDDGLALNLVAGSSFTIQYTTAPNFTSWSPTAAQPNFVFRVNRSTSGVAWENSGDTILNWFLSSIKYGVPRIHTESDQTQSVAWGDYDNDGDLDQLAGNEGLIIL